MKLIKKIKFSTSKQLFIWVALFLATTINVSAQNKNCISFGLRYNQTSIANNIQNASIFSTNEKALQENKLHLSNNIGSEISYLRYNKISKTVNFNTGIYFQQERSDWGNAYTVYGKRHFNNIGINLSIEKRIKINEELSVGVSGGLMINKSSRKKVGLTDGGKYVLITNSSGDTLENFSEYESLYFVTKSIKVSPRFELNTYFKTGKHLVKFSFFVQIEAKKYNNMEYNWGFVLYQSKETYDAPTYYTEKFRMKIVGITTGYCF